MDARLLAAQALSGTAKVPAAADAAAQPKTGSFQMSRRQALAAAALPAAVAIGAISENTAPLTGDDPSLMLWRRWHAAAPVALAARNHADALRFALPEELRSVWRKMNRIEERLGHLDAAEAGNLSMALSPEQLATERRRLTEEYAAAEERLAGTGTIEAEAEANSLENAWFDIEHEIDEFEAATPTALALKMHLAIDRISDIRDPDWKMFVSLVRPMLPTLPSEMRERIEALIAEQKANAVRYVEAQRTAINNLTTKSAAIETAKAST
jgi:hypothetical protein